MVVIGIVAVNSTVGNASRSADAVARDTFSHDDLWVTAVDNDAWVTRAISPDAARTVRALPGVAAVRSNRTVLLDWQDRRVLVYSADTVAPQSSVATDARGRLVATDAARLIAKGAGILISPELAEAHHVKLADSVRIPTPSGPQELQIVGYVPNYGWLPGVIGLSSNAIARWWREPSLTALKIDVGASGDLSRVRARVCARWQLRLDWRSMFPGDYARESAARWMRPWCRCATSHWCSRSSARWRSR